MPSARWACVYTHSQAERWADANLRRAGYVTYLPLVAVLKRDRVVRSLRHEALVPLYPRYLFVQFDARAESWSPIRAAPGVADLVRCGSEVQYARAGAVSALQAGEALRRTHPSGGGLRLAPGSAVGVSRGILEGQRGVVVSVGRTSARVTLLMLGQLRDVTVPLDALQARMEE